LKLSLKIDPQLDLTNRENLQAIERNLCSLMYGLKYVLKCSNWIKVFKYYNGGWNRFTKQHRRKNRISTYCRM